MKLAPLWLIALLITAPLVSISLAQDETATSEISVDAEFEKAFAFIEAGLDDASAEQAARHIREAFILNMLSGEPDQISTMKIAVGQFALREYIVKQYGVHDYEAARVFSDYNRQLNLSAKDSVAFAIRMAKTLDHSAIIWLETVFSHNVEGTAPYIKDIFDYIGDMMDEGFPRAVYFSGKILLNGIRVPKNEASGIEMLEFAAQYIDEPLMELITYTYENNDEEAFQGYLAEGVAREIPQAMYNHAVLQQQAGNYADAFTYFTRTIDADPGYIQAKLELARMYVEGWGTEKSPANIKKGVTLFKDLAKEDKPAKIRALALLNLSILSKKGIGMKQSDLQSKRYMNKAQKLGIDINALAK